ncbi:MAG: aminotransferase class V-fold PLP-dependent enzyme [Phycisphaerales bacterium]|nr:aminotransferase class V-fold PLP-dependent enzyme [Phycisphaerales bacterium]
MNNAQGTAGDRARLLGPPEPIVGAGLEAWGLDPRVNFLNHGSFGARPREVMRHQGMLRDQFEAAPIEVLDRKWRGQSLLAARDEVASFLGASGEDIGFVHNASTGVACVLRNLKWSKGDEIVTTDHAYNAVFQMMRYIDTYEHPSMRQIKLPFPVSGHDEIIERVMAGISASTRLLVIDHVTSPTGLRLPVEQICNRCRELDVEVLVDGAHGPGMLDLEVPAIGCDYYTGNLHKWVCAPPGSAFLWVDRDKQRGIHPLVVSHHYEEGFAQEFVWQGTGDMTPWLTAPIAIQWLGQFGWDRIRKHNRDMVLWAQSHLCRSWSVEPASPRDGSMLGSMAAIELPGHADLWASHWKDAAGLMDHLYQIHLLEVPVMTMWNKWWVRISCHLHNSPQQYEHLAAVILEESTKIGAR